MACFQSFVWIVLCQMKILTTVKSIKNELFTCVFGALIMICPAFGQTDTTQTETVANDNVQYVAPKLSQANIKCLTPPEGFVVSEAFNGYIHFQTSSTILIQYIENTNFIQLEESMNENFFERNNLNLVSKVPIETEEGISGVIYSCTFTLRETEFVRYIVYLGDLNNTLWLNITYPEMVEGMVKELLMSSINSTQFKLAKNEE